jgi:hypothetical protein
MTSKDAVKSMGKELDKAFDRTSDKKKVKEEVELEEAKRYPYKFRATYHDPDTNEVTHYFDFTHRNLEAAKKHAQGSRLERWDGKQDKLHSVVQMKEAVETSQDKDAGKITTDMLTGRVPGGKLNSFKSFKTNLTTSGTISIPSEIEKGEETKASQYHSTNPGPVDVKLDDKLSGPTPFTYSSKDKQVKNEEVKPELKKLRSKESKEQTKEVGEFNKKVTNNEEVEPINEDKLLDKYLLSKGMNPKFVSQAVKISHAKSGAFMSWRQSHQNESVSVPFDKPYKSVSRVTTDKSGAKHTPISRAKDLARSALKKIKQDTGNEKG